MKHQQIVIYGKYLADSGAVIGSRLQIYPVYVPLSAIYL